MKKILAIMCAVFVLLSAVPVIYASNGVSYMYSGTMYNVTSANPVNTYEFTDNEAYSGIISLHMRHVSGTEDTLTLTAGENEEARIFKSAGWSGKYYFTFRFYTKGTLPDDMTLQIKTTNGRVNQTISKKTGEVTVTLGDAGSAEAWAVSDPDENGWQLHEIKNWFVDPTAESGGGNFVITMTVKEAADFYLDDFNFDWELRNSANTVTGNETGLLDDFDPSFEMVTEKVIYEEDYSPSNLLIQGGASSLMLGWRNPVSAELTSVRLYDITDDMDTELTSYDISQLAGANVNLQIKDLKGDEYRYYKIVSEFLEHAPTEFVFGSKVAATSNPAITEWGVLTNSDKIGYCPIKPYIYSGDSHTGEASLRIISAQEEPTPGNNYLSYSQKVDVSAEKKYELSFWAKGDCGWVGFNCNWSRIGTLSLDEPTVKDWFKTSYTLNNPASTTLRMIFEHGGGFLLIDDIELYELDEDGQPIGENLVKNGDFETGLDLSNVPDAIFDVSVSDEIPEKITLSWESISGSGNRVNVYKKVRETYVPLALVCDDRNSIEIASLACDEENTIAISTINSADIESELYEFTVVPKSPECEIGDIMINGDAYKDAVLSSGYADIRTEVKNNRLGDDFTAELVAALYKDGVLTEVFASSPYTVYESPSYDYPTEVRMTVNIPDLSDGDYTMKIFLWDDFTSGKVLKPSVSITE